MEAKKTIRQLIKIPAGVLFRGLYITYAGNVFLSTRKWTFEQKKYVKGLWSTVERETFSFEYVKNIRISSLLKTGNISAYTGEGVSLPTFRRNGTFLFKEIITWTKKEVVCNGDCLGMSLGESIVAVRPFNLGTYRPDFYEVYLFHKVLYGDAIKWIILQSNSIRKNLVIHNPNDLFLDVEMKLV